MTLSNARDEVFHAEVVNVFQPFNTFAKRSAIADGHNPGHVSDIFFTIFTVILPDCLKQT